MGKRDYWLYKRRSLSGIAYDATVPWLRVRFLQMAFFLSIFFLTCTSLRE